MPERIKSRVLYLGQKPAERTGSPVIMERHLRRLGASGYDLQFCLDFGEDLAGNEVFSNFKQWILPHRLLFWPPYNPKSERSRVLRTHLWAGRLARQTKTCRPDSILTYMAWHSDLFAEIGGRLAKMLKVPSLCLVHDDAAAFTADPEEISQLRKRQKRILGLHGMNAFVCKELGEAMLPGAANNTCLWPIPEGSKNRPKGNFRNGSRRHLVYAGYCWAPQAELIAEMGSWPELEKVDISVIGKTEDKAEPLFDNLNLHTRCSFGSNGEALDYLSGHADVLLVSYSKRSGEMPWSRTSFPSKLIEYAHLGLPILIVAPEDTAVFNWCRDRKINGVFSSRDRAGIGRFLLQMQNEDAWTHAAQQWIQLAEREWSPEVIHGKFVSLLGVDQQANLAKSAHSS